MTLLAGLRRRRPEAISKGPVAPMPTHLSPLTRTPVPTLHSMFIHETKESVAALAARGLTGPLVMLNLLRYRVEAEYSDSPELAPLESISGEEAYRRYVAAVLPVIAATGAEMIFMGEGGNYLIGPADEEWDEVLLVRYPDLKAFMGMVASPEYQAVAGHRTAGLADSRLLPIVEEGPALPQP